LAGGPEEANEKPHFLIRFRADIWTRYLPDTKQECYPLVGDFWILGKRILIRQ
jgi:hypothetical protein